MRSGRSAAIDAPRSRTVDATAVAWRTARGRRCGSRAAASATGRERARSAAGARRRRSTRSTSRSWSSSTTCAARPPAPSSRSPGAYQEDLDDVDLRGDRGRERLRRRPEARRRVRGGLRTRVPLPRPRRTRPSRRRSWRSTAASRPGEDSAFALMIDGAHVLTPGVLHFGLAGLATYAPAIVATQQWYVGPGQQGDAMDERLRPGPTRIACSSGSAGRAPGTGCSRSATSSATATGSTGCGRATACSFRSAQLEQVGCFDESFSMRRWRVRQPRALRAARLVARRHGVHDHRRGLVPPGPRRHHHQPDPTPPNGAPGCSATASSTPSSAAAPSRAPASRSTTSVGSPTARPAARSRAGCRPTPFAEGAAAGLHDGSPGRSHADARRAAVGVHRGGVAQPAVDEDDAGWASRSRARPPTSSPTRS